MSQNDGERLLLKIPEAAEQTGLGRTTIYRLIQSGDLQAIKIGAAFRIPASALREWVERQIAEQAVGGAA